MAIDVETPLSAGWWFDRLNTKLNARRTRADRLASYYRGDPPLPEGARGIEDAYRAFQRKARTNFAELIVEALRERCVVAGFRTGATGDDVDDETAWKMFRAAGGPVELSDATETSFALGDGYVIAGKDPRTGKPILTSEDPRQVVTEHDPQQQRRVVAALKQYHDDVRQADFAFLFLAADDRAAAGQRVRMFVFVRSARSNTFATDTVQNRGSVAYSGWDYDSDQGGETGIELPVTRVPVVRLRNKRGVGEFETHIDLLDRINHMLLQRMVIATMQAFRQRAIVGDLPDVDDDGNPIDWADLLSADPGAFWRLPADVTMWESQQVDLTPILSSVKDDVLHLAAVTRTPLHMLTPDAAAQGSAEGATLQREGLVFKAEDRQERLGVAIAQLLSLMFELDGDAQRADVESIDVLWRPAERYSLTERAQAAQLALQAGVPWATRMTSIMQYSPQDVTRMDVERADDAVLQQAGAAVQAANVTVAAQSATQAITQAGAAQNGAAQTGPSGPTGAAGQRS